MFIHGDKLFLGDLTCLRRGRGKRKQFHTVSAYNLVQGLDPLNYMGVTRVTRLPTLLALLRIGYKTQIT